MNDNTAIAVLNALNEQLNDQEDAELINPPGGQAPAPGEVRYMVEGSALYMTNARETVILDKIPAGTYTLMVNNKGLFYLEQCANLAVPPRLYGKTQEHCAHFLAAFLARTENTGVLLTGEKGSGKSLLGCVMSSALLEQSIPTILVNQPYVGDAFNAFIAGISQPCMVYFDEFEKVYNADKGAQERLLTLLAGVYQGKKLFVFTSNAERGVDRHMLNRPGRILYHVRYFGVDQRIIEEYATEHLVNQEHAVGLQLTAAQIGGFNFDMLKNLVEEMNRFGEPANKAIQLMNIRPEATSWITWTGKLYKKGEQMKDAWVSVDNPLVSGCTAHYDSGKKDGDGDPVMERVNLSRDDIKKFDMTEGTITFEKDKWRMEVKRKYARFDHFDAF
jgi:hypothetical protein